MSSISKMAIIGPGKLGRYFHRNLRQIPGLEVDLFGRHPEEGCKALSQLYDAVEHYHLIWLCVPDQAIDEVSTAIPSGPALVVHASGATDLQALNAKHQHRGVFYPLMSFTAHSKTPLNLIPICLEAEEPNQLNRLYELVEKIGAKPYEVKSAQRRQLHLAAVFAHNFTNHCLHIAETILAQSGLDSKLLNPLLQEHFDKLSKQSAAQLQTGPALRDDQKTMEAHLALLSDEHHRQIYKILSKSIQQHAAEL